MRKVIAAINMTIDGVFDHTAGLPDEEIHQHYTDLIDSAGTILYGRITYQLMQYWQTQINNPSGEKTTVKFATAIGKIQKIVFSHTLKNTGWDSAKLATKPIDAIVTELKQQPGPNILVGSGSLITQLLKLDLIDEFQLCVHPVIAGNGLSLFEHIHDRTIFKLTKTKIFNNGAVTLYYEPIK